MAWLGKSSNRKNWQMMGVLIVVMLFGNFEKTEKILIFSGWLCKLNMFSLIYMVFKISID